MKLTCDTNVLIRLFNEHDLEQSKAAQAAVSTAELIAIPLPVLCEFVWVFSASYKRSAQEIARLIRNLIDIANVVVDRPSVEAGLAMLEAGGDFADGVIGYQGGGLGGDIFVSFDKRAVRLLAAQGHDAKLLS